MTLKKNEAPDWAAAGLDYVGGDRSLRANDVSKLFPIEIPPVAKKILDALNAGTPVSIEPVDAKNVPPEVKAALDKFAELQVPPLHPMCKSVITPTPADDYAASVAKDLAAMHKPPITPASLAAHGDELRELVRDLADVRKEFDEVRRGYWINLLRAFAAGVIIAWIVWTIAGGPS